MMERGSFSNWMALLGRIGLSLIFVTSGFAKIGGFAGMVAFATMFNVPFPEAAIVIAIIVEFIGGLMVLFGFKTRLAGLAIALFLIPVTLIFHSDFADQTQMTMFWKNVAIIGGLFMVAAHGAGAFSIDGWRKKKMMSPVM